MNLLDEQLTAGLKGDFITGQRLADELAIKTPDDPRAAFNRGWYELRKGNFRFGHSLLDKGRFINVFGNRHIGSSKPIWNGEEGTVLLRLEGGLGDQIHGFRFAKEIEDRGNRVVVCCSPELASLFAEDFTVIQPEAACGVFHDYWLPSMSAVVSLGHTYETLSGSSYIPKIANIIPGRVGVRWSGNPQFEHEQYRLFSKDLMFDAVEDLDIVSLQRDTDDVPDWMEQPSLETWEDTRKVISECELIISSCTSVAHLAAAMGIDTWIIVPILPYYLWALPGDKSPYYDSVTLYRQKEYKDWKDPFKNIKKDLEMRYKKA